MARVSIALLLIVLTSCAASAARELPFPVPADESLPPITPSWAFSMWVWEDDANNAAAVWDLVNGYPEHDIPIGAVLIDSPWATLYNNFRWDTKRYPEPQRMIDDLHRRGVKVVLWMTGMVNLKDQQADASGATDEDIYAYAKEKGYLCNDGKTVRWWKGTGAFPDYTNPDAVAWWHGLMDRVLDMGIDGWKVDGSSGHFPLLGGYGKAGPLNMMQYSDMYYRDTYQHLVTRRPHGVTMVRSVDAGETGYEGRHSPRDAAPVTWVGDQRHTWDQLGILEALKSVFLAIGNGYPVIGSDTGGYQTDPAHRKEMPTTLFLRWAQWNALMPFFINGGHDEHRPWKMGQPALDIFRKYAWLHQELTPYWFSSVARAHLGDWRFLRVYPGQWEYGLGEEFLVAPIYQDSPTREVQLPAGRWHDYWHPERSYNGPVTMNLEVPLEDFPLFVKQGAIIPLQVSRTYTALGDPSSAAYTTLDVYPGADGAFDLYDESSLEVTHLVMISRPERPLLLRVSGGVKRAYILRTLRSGAPEVITLNGQVVPRVATAQWAPANVGWRHDADTGRLWVKFPSTDRATLQVR